MNMQSEPCHAASHMLHEQSKMVSIEPANTAPHNEQMPDKTIRHMPAGCVSKDTLTDLRIRRVDKINIQICGSSRHRVHASIIIPHRETRLCPPPNAGDFRPFCLAPNICPSYHIIEGGKCYVGKASCQHCQNCPPQQGPPEAALSLLLLKHLLLLLQCSSLSPVAPPWSFCRLIDCRRRRRWLCTADLLM